MNLVRATMTTGGSIASALAAAPWTGRSGKKFARTELLLRRETASELERRWNEKLEEIEAVKQRLSSLDGTRYSVSPEEETRIRSMGDNFAEVWQSDRCPPFGPAARFDPDEELSAWADYALKGAQNEIVKRAPVRIFVMGENVWREEQEWPPRRARPVTYYLHSGGNANSSSGDGLLGAERPASEPHDQFVHDPRNPVPTMGGPLCCDLPAGPHDQSGVEARSDVLVYSTPVLRESLEVTGPVKAVLYVGSDAPDTDFAAKLLDVYPDGKGL